MPYWRQKQKQKPRREPADVIRERDERRTAALAQCVREMNGSEQKLTHTLLAERVGVPVQFVRWKYPSMEQLLEMAET